MSPTPLTIKEEALLLALHEDHGRPLIGAVELRAAVSGAVLAELALAGRVQVWDGQVTVIDATPPGDPELDTALARMAIEEKQRTASWWVGKLYSDELRVRLLSRLVDRGVITEEERRVLRIFKSVSYPAHDHAPEAEARLRLRHALGGGAAEPRTVALLAIAHACKLDRKLFTDIDERTLKHRVAELTADQWAGQAVAGVVQSIQSAVTVAITAAATASVTTTNN